MRGLRVMLSRSRRGDHERLLDAAPHAGPTRTAPGPTGPLADLLRAAAGPARERELAGEEAAVAAFRTARQPGAAASTPRRRRRRFTVGAVAWVAGLAATATAGVALAAAGLDGSGPVSPPVVTSPAAPAPTIDATPPGETGPTGAATAAPTDGPTAAPTSPPARSPSTPVWPPGASARPSPGASGNVGPGNSENTRDHPGLCRAYLAKSERQREQALRTPAFQELVVAAGGAEHIEEYCHGLRAEPEQTGSAAG
ncbi:hypothetical protein [Micromonospora sediminimaris]|uniref:Uncharacterized protein n=1 Tax=Micromonospora sediminimaris TaxID=547162 RepID=A0A9W5XJ91_9ACTN|nr:hypothetical protein [Micromonospora sediminimaris]GIJ31413.1 hypothetical protein Vse01_05610 [Micromonospora sediminimaris]SFC41517.1 hypothetical protein SAMN05216284_104235 [Micromonospora sediminimaris]